MNERPRSSFLAATGAGLAAAALPQLARAQATPLRIAGVMSDLFGEPFYAKQAGAFARAGFDLDVTNLANGAAVIAAIAGGSLDIAVADLIAGVNAINAGVPVALVAGSGLYSTSEVSTIVAVLKDSPIKQPVDLIGKTIATPSLVGIATAALRLWLPQNGVALESVKIIELPLGSSVAAMQRGVIDATMLIEPFLALSRNLIRDVGHPFDAVAKEFLVSVWYASRAWIDADRKRARRAVNAIYETARWANSHRADTFAILVRETKMDGDRVAGMVRVPFATTLTAQLVQPVLNVATQGKIFDRALDANALITRL